MLLAYSAVLNGMSVNRAAMTYNVPRSTLCTRVNGKTPLHANGPATAHTEVEENCLDHYIRYMSQCRLPVTARQVMLLEHGLDMNKSQRIDHLGQMGQVVNEVCEVCKNACYCEIWQIFALSSILGVNIRSIYPGHGTPEKELNRHKKPRRYKPFCKNRDALVVMWTNNHNDSRATWWKPNHFVPIIMRTCRKLHITS